MYEMINFKKNQPIIIGLAGKAGSGKTSVAESIVPKGSIETTKYGIKWDHIFYALPLYEMASIKKNIQGLNQKRRRLYAIHDAVYDLYGGSSLGDIPEYEQLVSIVQEIYSLPIEPEGVKPRDFLQKAGDICRLGSPDCFARWAITKSMRIYRSYLNQLNEEEEACPLAVLVSDVRYPKEAEHILKLPNGVVVCFDASTETLNERLFKRDGKLMDLDHAMHPSENAIEEVKKMSTIVINTNEMSLQEQTENTLKLLGIKELTNA
jgi:ABC-type oligopeptide transport system ATPase subunit